MKGGSPVAKARYLVEAHLVEGRSVSELWQRLTACIAAGSTSSWRGIEKAAMRPWSHARGHRDPVPTARPRR
jgi:hypothetical protein